MEERDTSEPQGDSPFSDPPVRRRNMDPQQSPQQAWGQPQPGYGPPPGYYAPPPAKKKTSKFAIGCLSAVVLVVAIGIGAALASAGNSPTAASTTPPAVGVPAGTVPASAAAPLATTVLAAPVKTVVLQKSGSGTLGTASFTVGDDWSLTYSFDCSSFGQAGNFQVYEDYPNGDALVNELALKGSDVSYQHGDAGTHSLEVNSECKWSITVTDGDG